jgi:hypothetical protein
VPGGATAGCVMRRLLFSLIMNWYGKMFAFVKRGKAHCTGMFHVKSGVRQGQGGVLSPILFNLYIDVIITALKKSNLCCHILVICKTEILYGVENRPITMVTRATHSTYRSLVV